jgi:CO/xanthine dehydrogenase Mo-binding subunit
MADLAGVNGTRKDFRVVGKPNLPGVLSWAQATGVAKFGIDYVVPDMLHAKFLRSPYANARIKKLDTTKARAIPGVVDISHGARTSRILAAAGRRRNQGFLTTRQPGRGGSRRHHLRDGDICDEAATLQVEWEVPFVRPAQGREPDAGDPTRNAGGKRVRHGGGDNPPKKESFLSNTNDGDVEKGFKEADHIIEYDVNTSAFAGHIPNPLGTVAWWFDDPLHGEGKNLQIEGVPGARPGGRHEPRAC